MKISGLGIQLMAAMSMCEVPGLALMWITA